MDELEKEIYGARDTERIKWYFDYSSELKALTLVNNTNAFDDLRRQAEEREEIIAEEPEVLI